MVLSEEPCNDCKDLIKKSYLPPHKQLLDLSVMPDHKLYNCNTCGAFATFCLSNAAWEVEMLMSTEAECE